MFKTSIVTMLFFTQKMSWISILDRIVNVFSTHVFLFCFRVVKTITLKMIYVEPYFFLLFFSVTSDLTIKPRVFLPW